MLETDKTSLIGRATQTAPSRGFRLDGSGVNPARTDAQTAILMWVAGVGYRPLASRAKNLRPQSKSSEKYADDILSVTKPDDPILAANMRAKIQQDLHEYAIDDERSQEIFAADPVVVADPRTGWIVTQSVLYARVGLFDSINTLLQKPYLSDDACVDLRNTLITAFPHLSADSQREWAHSECRLEQGLRFLETRAPSEIITLAEELLPVDEKRGIWDTIRLFSLAAQMGSPVDGPISPVTSLLTIKDTSH